MAEKVCSMKGTVRILIKQAIDWLYLEIIIVTNIHFRLSFGSENLENFTKILQPLILLHFDWFSQTSNSLFSKKKRVHCQK